MILFNDEIDVNECDCGGEIAAGGEMAGGISSGDVLGGCDHSSGAGFMGSDCFHMPFPVMPVEYRYGWTTSKKKAAKNAKSYKNPYIGKVKTIVGEDETDTENVKAEFDYTGAAKTHFDKVVEGRTEIYFDILYFNNTYGIAWKIDSADRLLKIYCPLIKNGYWTIYATHLTPDNMISFDYSGGRYQTKNQSVDALWKAAEDHRRKLKKTLEESRLDPRDIMNWEAHGRDPAWDPYAKSKERARDNVNTRALENELTRRFPHQFEKAELSNRKTADRRWTIEFKLPLSNGQTRITGMQRVAEVIPEISRILSFLRVRGINVNSYDVTAVNM